MAGGSSDGSKNATKVPAPRSQKGPVIEHIFDSLWDSSTNNLSRTMVYMNDVQEAIAWSNTNLGTKLSTRNPANFMKDLVRANSISHMWPKKLKSLRWSAKQRTGSDERVFEFVPYEETHEEPFPDRFGAHAGLEEHRIQSLSLPLATKELGRSDETYLIQIAVKLTLIETHFALHSPINVRELTHLQTGIKLRGAEVDSLYLATYLDKDGEERKMVVTVEAKTGNERLVETQIESQVKAAFKSMPKIDLVVPVAMMSSKSQIYVIEFVAIRRDDLASFQSLVLASEGLYRFVPPVPGC